jgi:TRAP-type C4-dicarboxylate transport system permease large subunit
MIEGWLRHFELAAEAKTGISQAGTLWGVIAAAATLAALLSSSIAAFIGLARRYDELMAAEVLAGAYFVIALCAVLVTVIVRRNTMARAKLALQARQAEPWIDPRLLVVGLEIGKTLGWKKTLPIAAISVIVAGLAREWSNGHAGADNGHAAADGD